MDIQNILNIAIQVIVMGFASLMIIDFTNRLCDVVLGAPRQPQITQQTQTIASAPEPQPTPTPQFEEIPDPWSLEPQSPHHAVNAPVILPFPTLRLLPPAKVQPITQGRKRQTTKSTQPKSTRQSKPRTKAKAV
ncbi:MAG TPA: hypothetical protein V6D25_00005 [Leptolyngbyaceae cyanobacterium]